MRVKVPPAVVRTAGVPLFRALAHSWRITSLHQERWSGLVESGQPYVFMCWHEALLPLLWRHRRHGIAIVVSDARDGQYLADLGASIGYRLVRGSSTRGAARALLGAVRELQAGHPVAFTPDGPRGPRRELKQGVIAAAQRGDAVILPLHAEADRAWRLQSWDRFMVPKPFSRVRIAYAEPIRVGPGDDGLQRGLTMARQALDDVTRMAAWPDAAGTPTG